MNDEESTRDAGGTGAEYETIASQYVQLTMPSSTGESAPIWDIVVRTSGTRDGGDGTQGNPYLIENVDDLQAMNDNLTAHYALANDIDASVTREWNGGDGFAPIGPEQAFTGSLDGRGYTITLLSINRTSTSRIGLFAFIDQMGSVSNLSLIDVNVKGNDYVGGLVGYNRGSVSNCSATENINGSTRVGGLVGYNGGGSVANCFATGNVSGTIYYIGGLVGYNDKGLVSHSYYNGNVTGTGFYVGGLVGFNNEGSVSNSHYNIDVVLINKEHHVTIGGLFNEQYQNWVTNGMTLNINDYSTTLIPSDDNYEIADVEGIRDLLGFADIAEYTFFLISDIDMSSELDMYIPSLMAKFDGNNHVISNLQIDQNFTASLGMFGYVDSVGSVSNVSLVDVNVTGYRYVGGLVGYNDGGSVSNCSATGNVSGSSFYVGGLMGINRGGSVSNCSATGNVTGDDYIGGLVGINRGSVSYGSAIGNVTGYRNVGGLVGENSGSVSNSFATGNVTGKSSVGGLVGVNNEGSVSNCSSTVNVSGSTRVGGLVGENSGSVSNTHATGNVNGTGSYVGGLVGENSGPLSNSFSSGNVTGNHYVGGLVGENSGSVSNSYATGNVTGNDYVGGLVGENSGSVSNCSATGNVSGSSFYVGGLLGYNPGGSVSNSYATGNVTGKRYVGGLVGINRGSVSNSYATGNVTGDDYVGGFVAYIDGGSVSNSFWDTETSGRETSAGGTGKTTAEMKTQSTFTNAGWDFAIVWCMIENITYPLLRWQDMMAPTADAGRNQTVGEYTLVTFDGSASTDNVGVVNFSWTFNDSTGDITLYGVNPTHIFTVSGIYFVTLNVTDVVGNMDTDDMTITVTVDSTPPSANAGPFQFVTVGSQVIFDGSASTDNAGIVNYSWNFNDGMGDVTLYGVGPTHAFAIPGVFNVTLIVTDAADNWDMDTMKVTVSDITPPTADAGKDQAVGEYSTLTFDGSASTDNVGIVNYTWIFNDGTGDITLYGVGPTHAFTVPGVYTVTLNITDAADNWDMDTMNVTVNDITPPTAIAGTDQSVDEGSLLIFDGSASTDNVGIVNYSWIFNDGTGDITLYGVDPTHAFTVPGVYTVILNVTDAVGLRDTNTMTVIVNDITLPTAHADQDQVVDEGSLVTFDGSISKDNVGIVNYTWTFIHNGTEIMLYGVSPTYRFWAAGNYTVTLTVRDAAGNTATDTIVVSVSTVGEQLVGDDDDGGIADSWWIILVILGLTGAAVIVGLVKRRKATAPNTDQRQQPPQQPPQ